MKMKSLIKKIVLLLLLTVLAIEIFGQRSSVAQSIPSEFSDLYPVLNLSLDTFINETIGTGWDGTRYPTSYGGELSIADNKNVQIFGKNAKGNYTYESYYSNYVLPTINNYKNIGVKVVKVQVHYPAPHLSFFQDSCWSGSGAGRVENDYYAYRNFYRLVSQGLKSAGIKFVLQSQTMPPDSLNGAPGCYYAKLTASSTGFARYKAERSSQINFLVQETNPEYIAIQSEPQNEYNYTGFSQFQDPAVNAEFLQSIINNLISANLIRNGSSNTLVAAGMGSWQTNRNAYIDAEMALNPGIDLFDIHVYSVNNIPGGANLLANINDMIDRVKAVKPNMKFGMSEAWLHKSRDSEVVAGSPGPDVIYSRDIYSFWAPLDDKFLKLIMRLAQWKKMDFISFSYPEHFYGYYDYESIPGCPAPASSSCSPAVLSGLSAKQGLTIAYGSGALNSTGQAFQSYVSEMLAPAPPVISNIVSSSITATTTTITWTTNIASNSQVRYGITSSYGNSTNLDSSSVTNHSVKLTGLTPNTLYHYQVLSQNSGSSVTTSADKTFSTLADSPVPPPPTPPPPTPPPSSPPPSPSPTPTPTDGGTPSSGGSGGGDTSGSPHPPVVVPPSISLFTLDLTLESTGTEVTALQNFLIANKHLNIASPTGYFGPLTKEAVINFQLKYGVISSAKDSGAGRVGPKTRAKLNELLGLSGGTTPPPAPIGTVQFTIRLIIGSTNAEVSALQNYLAKDKTLYPEGLVTGYYGALTFKAVGRFQEKYGIASPADESYGEVGPKTRAKLNELAR